MRPSPISDDDFRSERRPVAPPAYPLRATIPTWRRISDMSRSATYRALADGHLKAVKMGSRTLIDVPHGLAWLDNLPPATFRAGRSQGEGSRDSP